MYSKFNGWPMVALYHLELTICSIHFKCTENITKYAMSYTYYVKHIDIDSFFTSCRYRNNQ